MQNSFEVASHMLFYRRGNQVSGHMSNFAESEGSNYSRLNFELLLNLKSRAFHNWEVT